MLDAHIEHGRVVTEGPIPKDWEGRQVKIVLLTPDDPTPDLEQRLTDLRALGPVEWKPGEREVVGRALAEMDRLGRDAMQTLADDQP
jgi:hypothetical protein